MGNAFEPMSDSQGTRFRTAYLDYLRQRDGKPDLGNQRFDVREKFFAEVDANPICWKGTPPVRQEVFDRNHASSTPEAGLDEATLWALATAKTNRAERYGVEYSILHQKSRDPGNDPHAYIQIEEFYHTRILKDALATLGLKMDVGQPGFSARALVRSMTRLPPEFANVFVLCGEVFGVVVFTLLLEKARVLFKEQPEALARIEALFGQILVDEVGHVHFVRSTLGPARVAWARRVLPLVIWGALQDLPELVQLFGREEIVRRAKEADVDAAAASYPDRFIVPAS